MWGEGEREGGREGGREGEREGGREGEREGGGERERNGERKGENKEMTPPHTDDQKRARCLVQQCGFTILPHAPVAHAHYTAS